MKLNFPLSEDAIGLPVIVVAGRLEGATGKIDSLPDDPRSYLVLVELDRNGSNVWLDVDELEERANTAVYADRPEVLGLLRRLAEGVMRKARKDVEHTVGRTKRGPVDVSYNPATQLYEMTTRGGGWSARGRAGDIKKELMNLFAVVEGEAEPLA